MPNEDLHGAPDVRAATASSVARDRAARRARRVVTALGAILLLVLLTPRSALTRDPDGAGEATNPFAASALPEEERFHLRGRVLERIETGHYAYWRICDATGRIVWVVSLDLGADEGATDVDAYVVGAASPFHSRRLRRDFDWLGFAVVHSAS
ncbi:MAG: hypothetical protein AB7S26_05290 [Sandaracinaceae bacterium]